MAVQPGGTEGQVQGVAAVRYSRATSSLRSPLAGHRPLQAAGQEHPKALPFLIGQVMTIQAVRHRTGLHDPASKIHGTRPRFTPIRMIDYGIPCGLPVIASHLRAVSETYDDQQAGACPEGDGVAFAGPAGRATGLGAGMTWYWL